MNKMKEWLINTERTNLFEPNDGIGIKFTILGSLLESQLLLAFDTVVEKNETLHSKVILSKDGKAFYEKMERSNNKMIPMNENWETTLLRQQKVLFEIDKGELLRGFYYLEKDRTEVLFLAHHLAGDGKSMISFVEQFMEVLASQDQARLPYLDIRSTTMSDLPRKVRNAMLIGLYIKYYNWKWKKSGTIFNLEDRKRVHEQYWNNRDIVLCKECFTCHELEKLKGKAKDAKVSLSAYILTAFSQAVEGRIKIGIAIDGREIKGRNMGNQTFGTEISYSYWNRDPGEVSFEKRARTLQKKLKNKVLGAKRNNFVLYFMGKLEGSLVDSFYMQLFGDWDHAISKKMAKDCGYLDCKRYYSFSNLMKLDCKSQYGPYIMKDFLFIPPYISYGKRLIGVATLHDKMWITYQIKKDENSSLEEERFNRIMRELKK